jgi:hypothetical protein
MNSNTYFKTECIHFNFFRFENGFILFVNPISKLRESAPLKGHSDSAEPPTLGPTPLLAWAHPASVGRNR